MRVIILFLLLHRVFAETPPAMRIVYRPRHCHHLFDQVVLKGLEGEMERCQVVKGGERHLHERSWEREKSTRWSHMRHDAHCILLVVLALSLSFIHAATPRQP